MKYGLLPKMMWGFFKKTFEKSLVDVWNVNNSKEIMKNAHVKYKEIIKSIDKFDKKDRFVFNILSCAMLSAILLNLDFDPTVEEVQEYYRLSMMTNKIMKFTKKEVNYTEKGRNRLKKSAEWSKSNNNPYSWKFDVEDGSSINEYTATFHTCGICYLMKKLGLEKYIPAMCALDYDMAHANNTEFTREYTLASGGPYCDCHYNHKKAKK